MSKKKGTRAERELLHLFWKKGHACCRVAGSGSIPEPSCDLLVGNGRKKFAIECKTTKKKKQYFSKVRIKEFSKFAKKFGLKPLVAVRFARQEWFFISPEKLEKTKKGLAISLEQIKKKGLSFKKLIR